MFKSLDDDSRRLLNGIALITITASLSSFFWYIAGTFETITAGIILETIVSIVLTGIVALIYYRQWRIGKEQAEIARAQRDIADSMKDFQSRPAIDVVDRQPVRFGWKIYLGNFGFGPAHNLKLELDIKTDVEGYDPQQTTANLAKEIDEANIGQVSTNAILPKSEIEIFSAKNIEIELEKNKSLSLCNLFEELVLYGESSDTITIDMTVRALDAFDKEYTCDAGQHSLVIADLQEVSEYNISNIVNLERN